MDPPFLVQLAAFSAAAHQLGLCRADLSRTMHTAASSQGCVVCMHAILTTGNTAMHC